MSTFNLTAIRGDTIRLSFTVARDGNPVDITGSTLWFTAKHNVKDDDAAAVIHKTTGAGIQITDAPNGVALVTIDPADTSGLTRDATLVCDVQAKEASGLVTSQRGTLVIQADVTRAS